MTHCGPIQDQRQAALDDVQTRIDNCRSKLALLHRLQASLLIPHDERLPKQTMHEIDIMAAIQAIDDSESFA